MGPQQSFSRTTTKALPTTKPSLWQRYTSITPRTRILIGVGVMVYATFATYATDTAEKMFGLEAGEKDKEELEKIIPRVRVIDREEGSGGAR